MRLICLLFYFAAVLIPNLRAQPQDYVQFTQTFLPTAEASFTSPALEIPLHEIAHFVAFAMRCVGEAGGVAPRAEQQVE